MRTQEQWLNYQKLELMVEQRSNPSRYQGIWFLFTRIWDSLLIALAKGTEPHIWQIIDKQGQSRWKIYDPHTQQITQLASEEAVRIWLEQRFTAQSTNSLTSDWKPYSLTYLLTARH